MNTLENEYLKISIEDKGAELVSLFNKMTGKELLWTGDPEFWNRQSPVLFPNVGKQYGMHYLYNGIYYDTNQHGFARDSAFALMDDSANAVTMRLEANDETKKVFPFDFNFDINYELDNNKVTITWTVENTGKDTMYFTIGGHPGFNTLPEKSEYQLYFPGKDKLTYHLLNTETGCVLPQTYDLDLVDNRVTLNNQMFEKDALIFDDAQISECILETKEGQKVLEVISFGFPNYGIWSKPEGPFICLEPWDGRADNEGFNKEISEKPGVLSLAPGETYQKSYSILVY